MLPVLLRVGPVTVYSMGLMLFLALILGSFVFFKKAREAHFEVEMIFDVLFFSLFSAFIGARTGYILWHFSAFGFNLLRWLWVTNYVGLSFLGGLIFGVGAFIYKVRLLGEDIFEWLDYLSLGLVLGIGLGLLGTFLNGTYLGIETNLFIGLGFPGFEGKYLPIQLLGMIVFFVFFSWWWKMEKKYRTLSWYRAGKVTVRTGFLWFGFLIFFGVTFLLMGLLQKDINLNYGLNLNLLFMLTVVVVGGAGLYIRSGRRLSEEWKLLMRRRRRFSKMVN